MSISNSDNVIDSRSVIERIAELEGELEDLHKSEVLDRIEELEAELRDLHDTAVKETGIEADFEKWLVRSTDSTDPLIKELDNYKAVADFDIWIELSGYENEDINELKVLRALEVEAKDYCEWEDGAALIRESYFEEYCEELCKDIGDLPKTIPHYIVIDWAATAHNIRADYTEVDFDGEAYLVRE